MEELFEDASSFNEDIGEWDISGVTTMVDMFRYASAFNQDLGWCVADGVVRNSAWTNPWGSTFYNTPCKSTLCGIRRFASKSDCDVPTTGNVMVNWKIKQAVAAWLSDSASAAPYR